MISVVICSIDSAKYRRMVAHYDELLRGVAHEIIGIHDARSMCEGYNRGFEASSGEILIFSHDDVEFLMTGEAFVAALDNALKDDEVAGLAGTSLLINGTWGQAGVPYIHGQIIHFLPVPQLYFVAIFDARPGVTRGACALDGLWFAVRRKVAERIRFDAATFDSFHFYDLDFTFAAYLAGFNIAVSNQFVVVHYSVGDFDVVWERYKLRFEKKYQADLFPVPLDLKPQPFLQVFTKSVDEAAAICRRCRVEPEFVADLAKQSAGLPPGVGLLV